jgi:hypothetical protein
MFAALLFYQNLLFYRAVKPLISVKQTDSRRKSLEKSGKHGKDPSMTNTLIHADEARIFRLTHVANLPWMCRKGAAVGRISQLVTFWEEHRLAESVGVYSGLLHRIREASMDSPTISSLNALNRL